MIPHLVGWGFVLLLWVAGLGHTGAAVPFLLVLASSVIHFIRKAGAIAQRRRGLEAATAVAAIALVVAVPLAFDTATSDIFNATKYAVLLTGALVLLALWLTDLATSRRTPRWRSGVTLLLLAFVAWLAVTTATGINPRLSLVGAYRSYHGLLAVLAVAAVFFIVYDTFRAEDVPDVLSVAYFSAGAPIVFYALLQVHDRVADWGGTWDWTALGRGFDGPGIWSTLANGNHLSGFLASLVPVGVVLAAMSRSRIERVLIAVLGGSAMAVLSYTTTRGAWLALAAGLVVLGVFLLPELRRRPVFGIALPLGLVAVAIAAAAVVSSPGELRAELASVFDPDGFENTDRRELWSAGREVTSEEPLTGIGLEAFRVVFPRYHSIEYTQFLGGDSDRTAANGPHNIFLDYATAGGLPAAALLSAALLTSGLLAVRAVRRLRRREVSQQDGGRSRLSRLYLAAVAAALTVTVVQATFNVQQIVLTLYLWLMVALVCVLAADAEVSVRLLRRDRSSSGDAGGEDPARRRSSTPGAPWIAALAVVAALFIAYRTAGPYRAERHLQNALALRNGGNAEQDAKKASQLFERASREMQRAVVAHPSEPTYRVRAAEVSYDYALKTEQVPLKLKRLHEARRRYEQALEVEERDANTLRGYGSILVALGQADPSNTEWFPRAEAPLRRSIEVDPWQRDAPVVLAQLLVNLKRPGDAAAVVDKALEIHPRHTRLLQVATFAHRQAGNRARARDLAARRRVAIAEQKPAAPAR